MRTLFRQLFCRHEYEFVFSAVFHFVGFGSIWCCRKCDKFTQRFDQGS